MYGQQFITIEISSTIRKPCVLKQSLAKKSFEPSQLVKILIVSINCFQFFISVCTVCSTLSYSLQLLQVSATIASVASVFFLFSLLEPTRGEIQSQQMQIRRQKLTTSTYSEFLIAAGISQQKILHQ